MSKRTDYFKNKFREELLKSKMKAPSFVWDDTIAIPQIAGLSEHQQEKFTEIIKLVAAGQKRIVLKGSAGVGKTYLVDSLAKEFSRRLIKRWSDDRIYITAPTNKALSILKNKVDAPSTQFSTVHSALRLKKVRDGKTGNASFIPEYSKDKKRPFENCLFAFLDEASMLNTVLLEMLDQFSFPIIFIGDDKQLNPVGEEMSPVFHRGYPEVELTEIVRQGEGNPIIQLSRDLEMIYFKEPDMVDGRGFLYSNNKLGIISKLAEANGTDDLKYLAWINKDVDALNIEVRRKIYTIPNRLEPMETIVFDEPYKDYYTNQEMKIENLQIANWPIKIPTVTSRFNNSGEFLGDYETKMIKCYIANGNVIVPHEESDFLIQSIVKTLAENCREYKWDWRGFFYFKEQFANFKYNHALTIHKSLRKTGSYKTYLIDWNTLRASYTPCSSNDYSIVKEMKIGQSAAKLPVLGRRFRDYRKAA